MNIVFCAQCSEGAKEGSDGTVLKTCFCPQHSLKFGSKTSPQLNAVLRAGEGETLKVGSSCLNKTEFFSTQHKRLLLCLANPQFLSWWLGVEGAAHFLLHNLPIFIWSWAAASGPGLAPWAPSHRGGLAGKLFWQREHLWRPRAFRPSRTVRSTEGPAVAQGVDSQEQWWSGFWGFVWAIFQVQLVFSPLFFSHLVPLGDL